MKETKYFIKKKHIGSFAAFGLCLIFASIMVPIGYLYYGTELWFIDGVFLSLMFIAGLFLFIISIEEKRIPVYRRDD